MIINNYITTKQDQVQEKRGPTLKWILLGVVLLLLSVFALLVLYELNTSKFQAREFSRFASSLTYTVGEGPSDAINFPQNGPFDKRLGYAQLPDMLQRATAQGMQIKAQSRFSPQLLGYTAAGYFAPYTEKFQTGLHLKDTRGEAVYQFRYPRRVYASFDEIPVPIVQSLLFIENRELLDTNKPYLNPAVDWVRFSKASLHQLGKRIGLDYETIGGSTLATQLEKYRHSPEGITATPEAKLKQMYSASVRAYQRGPVTMPVRQELVLSYVNTVPLSGAPGYGEVHGLGDGLWVWFGAELQRVNNLLNKQAVAGDTLLAQGQALRQVLSLMIAQRRPSFYLGQEGREELNSLTGGYLRLLASNGYISGALRDAGLAQEVQFRDFEQNPPLAPRETNKGTLVARTHLSQILGKPLYDLDRLDLSATTTLHTQLQQQVSDYLDSLNKPAFAREVGLIGERMLSGGKTEAVHYSFTLFERTPQGNLVRVQTDNTNQPFDLNEGSKLELGSTAKLRVLITYLEIIAEIHEKYSEAPKAELRQALRKSPDPLSYWTVQHLLRAKDISLAATLQAALLRRYSASPYEAFFTGGGVHYFHNFSNDNNRKRPTVHEAFLKSINLPFVRVLRDVVRYTTYQQAGDYRKLLANNSDPRRRQYLTRFADREGQTYLLRFWHKYKNYADEERFELLLKGLIQDEVRFAAVHRYLYPNVPLEDFSSFLQERLPDKNLKEERIQELYGMYGPDAYTLPDQGYITKTHPLELWLLQHMLHNPDTNWPTVVEASQQERQEVYKWLFRTRFKSARDSRIRTMLELDAFQDIHTRWRRLGYPFGHLVPSLATALGSSGDRPEALAELMGIIQNNGIRQRTLRIQDLHFAAHTPYETSLAWQQEQGKEVLNAKVAQLVRNTLSEVVELGTARRVRGGFTDTNGVPLLVGGKTGTGDNRLVTMSKWGQRISSKAVNRTATFVFYLGDRHFGTLTAFVPGSKADDFGFTSSLPVQVLRGMAPFIQPYLQAPDTLESVNN